MTKKQMILVWIIFLIVYCFYWDKKNNTPLYTGVIKKKMVGMQDMYIVVARGFYNNTWEVSRDIYWGLKVGQIISITNRGIDPWGESKSKKFLKYKKRTKKGGRNANNKNNTDTSD